MESCNNAMQQRLAFGQTLIGQRLADLQTDARSTQEVSEILLNICDSNMDASVYKVEIDDQRSVG